MSIWDRLPTQTPGTFGALMSPRVSGPPSSNLPVLTPGGLVGWPDGWQGGGSHSPPSGVSWPQGSRALSRSKYHARSTIFDGRGLCGCDSQSCSGSRGRGGSLYSRLIFFLLFESPGL